PITTSNVTREYELSIPGECLQQRFAEIVAERTTQALPSAYLTLTMFTYSVYLGTGPSLPGGLVRDSALPQQIFNATALVPPISLCTYWRCTAETTDFRLDYATHWPKPNPNQSEEIAR
ncbi:unnamed protein product, partial [Protopolystoma xenopodis]